MFAESPSKKAAQRWNTPLNLLIAAAILVVLNLLVANVFYRIDLTKEKRYSLSPASLAALDSLQYPMQVTVYIEGDFPANVALFQEATRATLSEMVEYSHGNLAFEFVNPSSNKNILQEFKKRSITAIPVMVRVNENETKLLEMYPVAVMRQRDREIYIDLLKGCVKPGGEVDFAQAEADIEYKFIAAMLNILREDRLFVGFLQGHGELSPLQMPEFVTELQNSGKDVYTFDMSKQAGVAISPSIQTLFIMQPTQPFSERDKYELDQYLMRGGSLFFCMNQENVDMDMFEKRSTLTQLRSLNLDDLFMQYGFKINYDIIQDLTCDKIEIFQEASGGGRFIPAPWIFYPKLLSLPSHPICRNADAALLRYASSIDTFATDGARKSVFLQSSEDSRVIGGQQFIDVVQYVQTPMPRALFRRQGNRIAGVVAEGSFTSLFAGRRAPTDEKAPSMPTAAFGARSGKPGKITLISDGEFGLGNMQRGKRAFLPYDNKTILLNATDYLCGDIALTAVRSKNVVERRLNKQRVQQYATAIRVVNIGLPIVLLIVFGLIRYYWRKRKYEIRQQ